MGDGVYCAEFSPSGVLLATASQDNSAKLWNLWTSRGRCLHTYRGHADWVWTVRFSPAEEHIITASRDGTAKLWCTESGDCMRTLVFSSGSGADGWIHPQ